MAEVDCSSSFGLSTVTGGSCSLSTYFFFNDTATTEIYTLSLHDALPISSNAQTIVVDKTNPTESFPTVTLTSDTGSSGTDYITKDGHVTFSDTVSDSVDSSH